MSLLDRIEQLNQEVAELKEAHAAANRLLQLEKDTNALLRSQLADARKQLEVDSATIAKLSKDKRKLSDSLSRVIDSPNSIVSAGLFAEASRILSRHA